jgi:HEAT repeat protein
MGKIGAENTVDVLAPLLRDKDPLVREMTAVSFERIASPRARPYLREALEAESQPHIRQALEKALLAGN